MAELTILEEKLAEVIGLAQAAQDATSKVAGLPEATDELKQVLEQMGREAAETQQRGEQVAEDLNGKKTAIHEKARETKSEAVEMMRTYLGEDADALDGLEFLMMAEAGEMGHVEVANVLAEKAGQAQIREFIEFALPIQERHVAQTREQALSLAGEQDPNETG